MNRWYVPITRTRARALRDDSVASKVVKGSLKVVSELFIGEAFGFKTTPDQVQTRGKGWRSVVEERTELATNSISNNGVTYLSPDREGHCRFGFPTGIMGVADTKWTALASGLWTSEQRKLTSRTYPAGHSN